MQAGDLPDGGAAPVVTERWGMTIPLPDSPLPDLPALCTRLADAGYTDVWSSEATAGDGVIPLALAAAEPRLRLGSAILPVYTRGPALLAQTAATLAAAAPGRFVLGLGTSSNVIVSNWNSIPFTKPYQRVLDTVRFLRAAFAGEKVDEEFPSFTIRGFRLGITPPAPPKIMVAALRPRMLELAGREADGVILNWLSPQDCDTVLPHVHKHRPDAEVVARIFVHVHDGDPAQARARLRPLIAAYLTVPVYRQFHVWLGREQALAGMWQAWEAGDRRAALTAIPDEVVDDLIVHGTVEQCRARLRRYVEHGVTTPVLALTNTGPNLPDVMSALAAR
ncbi:probable F420-dependent oxidoreductase, Rv3093c family [Parafrankia irregularis]|uniref:Probable F420-dependent oxidoreductase, Rv3093c family n=1 Tax=Parafrankia irregularis TaxID=795642 RepID=A0A0S4QII2_9ACTN|nr:MULTISPECIES: LLM class F420-dependent oxidoreductase [Parafrankia]MBE3203822.1 LLM class F420-dependent oxidoreductase [Parafrankia sp. CH37]CUU55309.1 probable F420-dependent oxidoreductase, Rv3093c family [Parafrankia irregularis]